MRIAWALGHAEGEHDRDLLVLAGSESPPAPRWSATPFGHDATPSFHAASSIVLRGASRVEAGRPVAVDQHRDDEPCAEDVGGDVHRGREGLDVGARSSG